MEQIQGLTDMHTHFVYGVDDGAQTYEDMKAMLDMAHANRIATLYGTSHRTPGMQQFHRNTYHEHLEEARAYCAEKGYPITLYAGAEILYTPALRNYVERKPLRTLGDTPYVLMEFVPDVTYKEAEEGVSLLENNGYLPILAHIERYPCLFSHSRAYRLKDTHDVLFQVNCGTVIKGMGFFKTRTIQKWFRDELIDCVSSDMHNCGDRRNRMAEAKKILEKEYGEAYARKLTTWEP